MGKSKRKQRAKWLPIIVLALLAGATVLLSPGVSRSGEDALSEISINPDSLDGSRHFGQIRLDSALTLLKQLDPTGGQIALQLEEDSLILARNPNFPKSRFLRVYQNQRTSKDFRSLKNAPVTMLKGDENGYRLPVETLDKIKYVTLPYDILAGWLEEHGRKQANSELPSSKKK